MGYRFSYIDHANSLYRALAEDPFYITLEQSVAVGERDAHEAMMEYYDYSIVEAQQHGRLQLPETGIWGAAIWSLPRTAEQQAKLGKTKKDFIRQRLGSRSHDTYCRLVDFMDEKTSPLVCPDDWYLSIVGVAPEKQNQGLGPSLLAPVLTEADQAGVSTYLETYVARNIRFYERLGYQLIDSFQEPVTDASYSLMVRPPASGAQ